MLLRAAFGVILLPSVLAAQETTPLSAIDWLSRSVEPPVSRSLEQQEQGGGEAPVAQTGVSPSVTTTSLDAPTADAVGLLSPGTTGLPRNLWSGSSQDVLIPLLQATSVENIPAVQDILMTLLLAEADPPGGASSGSALFLARIDKLLDIGALDPAQALIEAAGPESPELYRRWFDISLLTGTEDAACAAQQTQPGLEPTFPARIFCLARNGDWTAAALTLNTARALGHITEEEELLLTHFLDPELFEGEAELPPPTRPSPLVFRMREAIGQGLVTSGLPRAFAHADLRSTVAWRYRMQAAERLIRTGAVSDNTLIGFYTERTPAASGGVWDRAAAVQAFVAAVDSRAVDDMAQNLPAAWRVMQDIRAEVAFARLYADPVMAAELTGDAARLAFRIGLLSPNYSEYANAIAPVSGQEHFWKEVALGTLESAAPTTPTEQAVLSGLTDRVPPAPLNQMVEIGQVGEALLRSIALFDQAMTGDTEALADGLSVLIALRMDDTARRVALQFLILDRPA